MPDSIKSFSDPIDTVEEFEKYFYAASRFLEFQYAIAFYDHDKNNKHKTASEIVHEYAVELISKPKLIRDKFLKVVEDFKNIRKMEPLPMDVFIDLTNLYLHDQKHAKEWLDEIINQMEKEINQRGWKDTA